MYYSDNKDLVSIKGLNFAIYLSARDIQNRIRQIAQQICKDYKDKQPKFLIVLNGAAIFGADLLRHCDLPCTTSFVKLKSYQGMESTGVLDMHLIDEKIIKDQDIIIIEDIIDTGFTMSQFIPKLRDLGAKSIKLTSLLYKPEKLEHDVTIDYLGFEIPEKFVVGYGLDYDGLGRNLPHIYQLVTVVD